MLKLTAFSEYLSTDVRDDRSEHSEAPVLKILQNGFMHSPKQSILQHTQNNSTYCGISKQSKTQMANKFTFLINAARLGAQFKKPCLGQSSNCRKSKGERGLVLFGERQIKFGAE